MNRQRTGLAVLDGRPKTPEQRRRAIEAELRALPELEAPATVWAKIEKRIDARGEPQRPFLKRALAAGSVAAAAAALSVVAFLSDRNVGPVDRNSEPAAPRVAGSQAPAATPERLVGELMERSRLAETRRRALPALEGVRLAAAVQAQAPESSLQGAWLQGTEARRLLAARIASVDASLNRLAASGPADPAAQERLWRERVELMDTLMRAEQVQREEFIRRAVH
ncbi:MAG: hypothetical protein OXQ29_05075 [Rhodospirillaceae bacterium]|nr:hypothetical protein [Rhodospirillaceae bacterium]